jgi:uncharacterized protein YdaU (DUF1376 family)
MHYYQWSRKDYAASTAYLTNGQDLAYRRMLDLYYDSETALPSDVALVARKVRCPVDDVQAVLDDKFTLQADGWHNNRADMELAKMHARAEKNRSNGALGGRKARFDDEPTGIPSVTQQEPTGFRVGSQQEPTLGIGLLGNGLSLSGEGEHERERPAPKPKRTKADTVERPDEVSEQHWKDWLAARAKKRAGAVTPTAWQAVVREARKAEWSLDAAVAECAARGWISFKAEWVSGSRPSTGKGSDDDNPWAGLTPEEAQAKYDREVEAYWNSEKWLTDALEDFRTSPSEKWEEMLAKMEQREADRVRPHLEGL